MTHTLFRSLGEDEQKSGEQTCDCMLMNVSFKALDYVKEKKNSHCFFLNYSFFQIKGSKGLVCQVRVRIGSCRVITSCRD